MKLPKRVLAGAALLLVGASGALLGVAGAHSEPPTPPPTPPPRTSTTRIMPPRWSWLHWWEANRDQYLVSPSQDNALQAPDPAQLATLREEAARELIKAIEGRHRDVVAAEAALALGKMRHEPALPLLKSLAANGDRDIVRRAALLGIGLLGTDAAENDLANFSAARLDQRVAARAAIGLLPDIEPETLRALRSAVIDASRTENRRAGPRAVNRRGREINDDQRDQSVDEQVISTVTAWTLRHHSKNDNLEYFRNLLAVNESPWVASEALLGLGGTRDHAAQRLLEEVLFGDETGQVRAYEHLKQMRDGKLTFAGGALPGTPPLGGQKRGQDGYDAQYENYVKEHERWYRNNPNAPKVADKQGARGSISLELGFEEISMGWLQTSAAIALGQLDAPRAGEALLRFISQDPAKDEYLLPPMGFAIMSLAAYPTEATRDRFIALLGKTNDQGKLVMDVTRDSPLRGFAALALGLYARPYETEQGPADRPHIDWAIMTLAERLEDEREEEEVRTACAVALGLTQRTAILPVLHRIATKMEQRNRRADFPVYGFLLLGRALAGDANIIEPASRFLLDRPDDASASGILARRAAVLALGVTRSSTAVPILTRAWHLSHYVNRDVILALRLVGGASAARPVMERLRNPENDLERAYMAQVLGELLAHEQPTAMSRLTVGSNYTVRNDHLLPLQAMANPFLFDYLIASFGEAW